VGAGSRRPPTSVRRRPIKSPRIALFSVISKTRKHENKTSQPSVTRQWTEKDVSYVYRPWTGSMICNHWSLTLIRIIKLMQIYIIFEHNRSYVVSHTHSTQIHRQVGQHLPLLLVQFMKNIDNSTVGTDRFVVVCYRPMRTVIRTYIVTSQYEDCENNHNELTLNIAMYNVFYFCMCISLFAILCYTIRNMRIS